MKVGVLGTLRLEIDVPLHVRHVVKMTGRSEWAVRWHARRGNLKYFRDPKRPKLLLFRVDAVLEFMERGGGA